MNPQSEARETPSPEALLPAPRREFAVAWRNLTTRSTSPIGMLSFAEERYMFEYLQRALDVKGLTPLLGFSDLNQTYVSRPLFPIFSQRIMDRRRPDFAEYLDRLGLPRDASGLDVLGRSGGHRKADTIQVVEAPHVDSDGSTQHRFFVHGVRHALNDRGLPAPEVARLNVGESLTIAPEPDNPVNNRALRVLDPDGVPIGWIPDLLIDYVLAIGEIGLRVARVNGPDVPPYLRVLADVSGVVMSDYRPFSGPGWESITRTAQ